MGGWVMASVRVENGALKDPRIEYLGVLLDTGRYDALGRMIAVWDFCTEHDTYIASNAAVCGIFGADGVKHLLEADLAEVTDEGLRIRGTAGRIEWLRKKREAAAKGGRAKHAASKRLASAKQTSSTSTASLKQSVDSLPLSVCPPAPALVPALVPVRNKDSTPASGADSGQIDTVKPPRFDFAAVYAPYPRKVNKAAGMRKIRKLVTTQAAYARALAAAIEMGRLWACTKDKTYCPQWSTWVSNQRWDDDEQQGPSKSPPNGTSQVRGRDVTPLDVYQHALDLETQGL